MFHTSKYIYVIIKAQLAGIMGYISICIDTKEGNNPLSHRSLWPTVLT